MAIDTRPIKKVRRKSKKMFISPYFEQTAAVKTTKTG